MAEKAIQDKVAQIGSHLLTVGRHQSGFKAGLDTSKNLTRILKEKDRKVLFLDLEKAFDRVDRNRLIHILLQKAETKQERLIVNLLAEVLKPNRIHLGEHAVTDVRHGVPQGGVLSPALFNVYLHEALTNHPVLEKLIRDNRLLAYADDLAIIINHEDEV